MITVMALALLFIGAWVSPVSGDDQRRPNIVLLCGEDLGPHLSIYGDNHAKTPNLEKLAAKGLTYDVAWSNAPVCAPARTTLATGMYATSLGAQHMRSFARLPEGVKLYPQRLREAGYTTVNHGKEDYNVNKPGRLWSSQAKLTEAEPPFFMKLNFFRTHESRIAHGRAQVKGEHRRVDLPPFHPDLPEARRNWATYYTQIEKMDRWLGRQLDQLRQAGLMKNTIVVFWGDHGPGLPRGKRFVRDFGLHVPLVVYIPPQYRDALAPEAYEPGGRSDRLVSFVDFAPTLLSLVGVEAPRFMQGRAFMGRHEASPRDYLFGFRGRMDESIDKARTVRDQRYQLIRNYMPHRRYGQYTRYLYRNPTLGQWQRRFEAGKAEPPASFYWQEKPPIELYDIKNDPHQVRNLAYHPDYQAVRDRLMTALREHQDAIRDTGFLPERQIHTRGQSGQTPYDMAHDGQQYPLDRIRAMAERAARRDMDAMPKLIEGLDAADPAVRYWAATATWPNRAALKELVKGEKAPTARVVAAEALMRYGNASDRAVARPALVELADSRKSHTFTNIAALNAIAKLDARMAPAYEAIKALPRKPKNAPRRAKPFNNWLLTKILADLKQAKHDGAGAE
jgi:uncharacterized sulfatase